MINNPVISASELERRTIRRTDLVSCNAAFIDCRTPGSDKKENYALIGGGVSQNAGQVINLQEDHGYNIGAAAMPNGVTNSLHMHFTAEVFFNFRGTWRFRWGKDGKGGDYVSQEGDIITVPTWIFRGFTNEGLDDGWLFTALGQSDTGGIIWGPSVLNEAEGHGLYLTSDNRLIDTVAGDQLPEDENILIRPMPADVVESLRTYSPEEMRARITTRDDLVYFEHPFLCSSIPGGGAQLAAVIGYGMAEDRDIAPRVSNPHSFNVAWLRAREGEGMLQHWHSETQVLIVKSGSWTVTLNEGTEQVQVTLEPEDTLSVPRNAWRTIRNTSAPEDSEFGELLVINGGDARVRLHWSPEVWKEVNDKGLSRDADGYIAPMFLLAMMTDDD
ncbi:cupin domain-containing protein [Arthrobacter sp. 31Y]|uniref:cupin domain-containing protein n=1 Tax=Arthrobacter sp. 31Y TaxID=1115632 RepID=UPI000465CD32|nr:cupin domain-containing protein [Arthrobacter sp. 31Y]